MDEPLWTDRYAPELGDLPQAEARERLERAVDEPMNLLVHGPPGAGKTAAVRALAERTHEDPDNDLLVVNVDDFFGRTKTEIRNDPRFRSFLQGRSDMAKRAMISHVIKETAGYAPVSGEYKTLLLDNAESVREDFQQALRRVMERYHRTTQFVVATRQPAKLIPPIRSRCFPVSVRAPTTDETVAVLEGVLDDEDVPHDREGVEYVAADADGDLRTALLSAQTVAESEGEVTMSAAYEALGDVGFADDVEGMLAAAERGDVGDARSELDDLLVTEGLDGGEVLDELLAVARRRYGGDRLARLHELAGEVDLDVETGTSDRVHLTRLLAELETL
jgi:replication factor C small subunit